MLCITRRPRYLFYWHQVLIKNAVFRLYRMKIVWLIDLFAAESENVQSILTHGGRAFQMTICCARAVYSLHDEHGWYLIFCCLNLTSLLQGFREPSPEALDHSEALILATQWKRKFNRHRLIEASNAGVDNLGLKVVNRNTSAPALSQIMMQRWNQNAVMKTWRVWFSVLTLKCCMIGRKEASM